MEESVALDSSKQKKFVKSVKGLKKLLKKQKPQKKPCVKTVEDIVTPPVSTSPVPPSPVVVVEKIKKVKRNPRGLVYLSHIPHGFYENEMSQYFQQFGMVTNVRVIRSKKTGNSKGFAFVEFQDTAVAQVVAETMNNYLMGKRLLKAVYIPPNRQKRNAKRMHWTPENNPKANRRKQEKKKINAPKSEEGDLNAARNMLKNLDVTKRKLKEMGIDYDFFKPVDILEGIDYEPDTCNTDVKDITIKKEEIQDDKKNVKVTYTDKKDKVKTIVDNDNLVLKKENIKKDKTKQRDVEAKPKTLKKDNKLNTEVGTEKTKINKLQDVNIELFGDFVPVQDSDEDSDGSLEFDSDEFLKAMDEDSLCSEGASSDESTESDKTANYLSNNKKLLKGKKNSKQTLIKKSSSKNVKQTKLPLAPKRKAELKPTASKRVKFEKQNKKSIDKVIKKKK